MLKKYKQNHESNQVLLGSRTKYITRILCLSSFSWKLLFKIKIIKPIKTTGLPAEPAEPDRQIPFYAS